MIVMKFNYPMFLFRNKLHLISIISQNIIWLSKLIKHWSIRGSLYRYFQLSQGGQGLLIFAGRLRLQQWWSTSERLLDSLLLTRWMILCRFYRILSQPKTNNLFQLSSLILLIWLLYLLRSAARPTHCCIYRCNQGTGGVPLACNQALHLLSSLLSNEFDQFEQWLFAEVCRQYSCLDGLVILLGKHSLAQLYIQSCSRLHQYCFHHHIPT